MTQQHRLLMVAAACVVTVAGCKCPGPNVEGALGEVRIHFTGADGEQITNEDGEYDFGVIPMGSVVERKLIVQNVGNGALTIKLFAKPNSAQTAVKVGSHIDDANPVFELFFNEDITVRASASEEIVMRYSPPLLTEGADVVDHLVLLQMNAENTVENGELTPITLKGRAIKGDCLVPEKLDFGAVARGDSHTIEYDFVNNRAIETRAFLGDIDSPLAQGVFVTTAESPKGEFTLAGGSSRKTTFSFRPAEGGPGGKSYRATVKMRRASDCPEQTVLLVGLGVDNVLAWSPAQLDFGYVSPGTTVNREVTITNRALFAQTLSPIIITDSNATMPDVPSTLFKFIDTGDGDVKDRIVVPAGVRVSDSEITSGSVTVRVSFSPLATQLGRRNASLRATTALTSQPVLSIPLTAVAGGPRIEAPAVLDLGRIGYFPNATTPSVGARTLTVRNIGSRPVPSDPVGNLKLGQGNDLSGFYAPFWEVVPLGEATLSEICVGVFDTTTQLCTNSLPETGAHAYQPAFGLEAGTNTARLEVPVRVTPNGYGLREWELRIFSNDKDTPVKTVIIKAKGEALEPCDITVAPSPLHFGLISPPALKDLAFSIRNNSTEHMCLISNLQLGAELGTPSNMPAIFSLTGGEVAELELAPAAIAQIFVRGWPQGTPPSTPANVQGKVLFNAAHPAQPQREVPLAAAVGNSCLTIAPTAIDFGTVKIGCYSQTRSFEIYNTCLTSVTINTSTLGEQGLVPAGEGLCPGGGAPCPEFFQIPLTPNGTVLQANSPVPAGFQVNYRPLNEGPDTGSMVLNVTQNGVAVDYVVPLQGLGNGTGINTDTFQQASNPRADILLVIDDSCSMGEEQDYIAANMDSFLSYAVANRVDFRIAVTTTDHSAAVSGKFCQNSGGGNNKCDRGNKVLTPNTERLAEEFADLVHVGIGGSGLESCMRPARDALTSPNITTPAINGGFLREEAVLAVVCITDASDQPGGPWQQYLSQLIAVKGAQRANMFTYNVIGPFLPAAPPGCEYDPDFLGSEHLNMVTNSNGEHEEICNPDWGPALERVGKKAFGYRDSFYLTSVPDEFSAAGIVVRIDGEIIPDTDGEGSVIWHYDSSNNTITFQPLYVPEPGQTLTVEYEAVCH